MSRKPLGNSQRFRILQRDGFRCQYCGRTPPSIVLHVDHVVPVVDGGENEDQNLVAACSDCNHGKFTKPPDPSAVPRDYAALAEETLERAEQLRLYREHLVKLREEIDASIEMVGAAFWGDGFTWGRENGTQERATVEKFLNLLGLSDVLDAARIAAARVPDITQMSRGAQRFRYFCGVCWNKCTERGISARPEPDA